MGSVGGGGIRAKLIKIGALYRNCRTGVAFEATRDGAPPDSDRELFHMCRVSGCKFTGARNTDYLGLNQGPRAVLHVGRFAFADNAAIAVPLADMPGPVSVATSLRHSKKAVVGLAILVLSLFTKLKQVLPEVDISKAASGAISYLFSVILGNISWGFNVVEGGVTDGITTFYWGEHPGWAEWVTRGFLYVVVVWYYGVIASSGSFSVRRVQPLPELNRILRMLLRSPLLILTTEHVRPTACTWIFPISVRSCVRPHVLTLKRS